MTPEEIDGHLIQGIPGFGDSIGGMCIAGDLPFGGYKASGIGREWGVEGIEEFLETKAIAYRI